MDQNSSLSNTYLSFRLDDEDFAINVSKVFSILEMSPITKIPRSPRYMKGVINLRGNVLPVIDLRIKFELKERDFTVDTGIIVTSVNRNNEELMVGLLVDAVKEVLEFSDREIVAPPSLGINQRNGFISGMTSKNGRFILVLDIDGVFSEEEIEGIRDNIRKGKN